MPPERCVAGPAAYTRSMSADSSRSNRRASPGPRSSGRPTRAPRPKSSGKGHDGGARPARPAASTGTGKRSGERQPSAARDRPRTSPGRARRSRQSSRRIAPTQARNDAPSGRPHGWIPPERVGRRRARPVTQTESPEPHRRLGWPNEPDGPHHSARANRPVGATRPAQSGHLDTRANRERRAGGPDSTRRSGATASGWPARRDGAAQPGPSVGQRGTPGRTRGGASARLRLRDPQTQLHRATPPQSGRTPGQAGSLDPGRS